MRGEQKTQELYIDTGRLPVKSDIDLRARRNPIRLDDEPDTPELEDEPAAWRGLQRGREYVGDVPVVSPRDEMLGTLVSTPRYGLGDATFDQMPEACVITEARAREVCLVRGFAEQRAPPHPSDLDLAA